MTTAGKGRMAAVLFTDLVGSTELLSRLGEAAFDGLRQAHFAALRGNIAKCSGAEVKTTGDGLLVTFASAADAVGCAVGMQQAVEVHSRTAGVQLAIRVGVAVGDVVFEEGDVFGTPVVEAARLVVAARGGQILATSVVRAVAGNRSEAHFADVGCLELKGLPAPVAACEVAWEPLPAPALPLPAVLSRAGRIFVGREAELEHLDRCWRQATAGARQGTLIAGEPGVGKTRLAAELASLVHAEGATVVAGRCDEDLGVPYQPFVEALRHFIDHTPTEDVGRHLGRYGGELARLVPELSKALPDLPPPLRSDPETERYRLFDAVAAWMAATSATAPVLFVLDDLQWAAKPTLLLLRHVLRSTEPMRLLVLATYRDTEVGRTHPLAELLADLRQLDAVSRVSLAGLDQPAVMAFLEQAAGHDLGEERGEFASAIHRETEGNAFFVREVVRHLTETGLIREEDGRWVPAARLAKLGIPEGVRDVLGRRLSRLSAEANQVLGVAAVAGQEFELTVVERVSNLAEDRLLSALDEAVTARLVVELPGPGTRYQFAHALVRATLYDELTAARRTVMHRRVAEAIEEVHGARLDDYLPALTHHWSRASVTAADTAQAVDYATRAGDRALTQLAPDEAIAYYRQALELLDVVEPADGQRVRLLIGLGEAQRQAGDPAHRETLLAAARLAAERGDADALARAALANTRLMFSSTLGEVDDDRVASLEAALEATEDDDGPTRARLLAVLGTELVFAGDRERRVRLADAALAIARRTGDDSTLAHVLLQNYYTIFSPDTHEKRLAHTEELVALAERLGDPVVTARASIYRARSLGESGNMDAADPYLDRAERLAEELGQPTLRWLVGHLRTIRTTLAGDLKEAERRAHAAFELGQATGQRDALTYLAAQLFLVRFDQGRLGELEERFAERMAAAPGLPAIRAYLALLLCELDRPDEAIEHYELLAGENFTGLPLDAAWILGTSLCAGVCAYLGDRARAPVLFHLLEPYANQLVFTAGGSLGAVAHHLAILATTSGDFDEAERRFIDAAATHERIGAPVWLARTRLEWARMLINRRRRGDAEQARELLGQVLTTARELGLGNVERRSVALLEQVS